MPCLSPSFSRITLSALPYLSLCVLPSFLSAQTSVFVPVASFPTADWLTPFPAVAPRSATSSSANTSSSAKQAASVAYTHLPLSFEPNVGQINKRAQFLCRGAGYSLFLTPTGAVVTMQRPMARTRPAKAKNHCLPDAHLPQKKPTISRSIALYMSLMGADPQASGQGEAKQPGVVSYFTGKDKSRWHSGISAFGQVRYRNVYPGMDLLYYGNQRQLEYDLIVKPGADYRRAALRFAGTQSLQLDSAGNLKLRLAGGETLWKRPVAYQVDAQGKKQWVASRYRLDAKHKTVRFVVGRYDRQRTLVLDPGLVYSTFLGGSSNDTDGDFAHGLTVDSAGNAYVTGKVLSTDFPTTPGAFQTTNKGSGANRWNVFVTKLSADGKSLVYSSYLGGSGGGSFSGDTGKGIAVDKNGNAYVTGDTDSSDFPVTPNAFQTMSKSTFVTKLSADGKSLVYSTYLGNGTSNGIAVDGAGNAYVTGYGYSDFPVTPGAFQTASRGAFITKLSADGKSLIYSARIAGSTGGDTGNGIAVDSAGNAYVVGAADSTDFPTTSGAFQTTNKGSGANRRNAFVTKLSADGKSLLYSTYLGGSTGGDTGNGIAVDSAGNAYVVGVTGSTDFPTTAGAFQTSNKATTNQSSNAFVTKLSADGKSLFYSTYLGGSGSSTAIGDWGSGIAVDSAGNAYVNGDAASTDFPTTPGAFQTTNKNTNMNSLGDAFVTKLSADGKSLLYSTYLGGSGNRNGIGDWSSGIAVDSAGNAYVVGATDSTDFPTTAGAFQTANKAVTNTGGENAFVTKLTLKATRPRFDANGDGNLDLLWYNQTNGDLTAWLQNGLTNLGSASLAFHVDTHWKLTGVADLNGDGNPDLLWRNQTTGDLSVWYMQGSVYLGYAYLAKAVPLAWQVVSCADINGDGNPDLIWRNTQTGDVVVWYMQGTTNTGYVVLASAVPVSWQLVGSTDLKNNGNTDLLWRNTLNGDLAAWNVQSQSLLISASYLAKGIPLEWQIGAAGDLDGNGVPDLIWRNTRTGDVAAWLFSDPTHYTGASIASAVPLNWQLVGPR